MEFVCFGLLFGIDNLNGPGSESYLQSCLGPDTNSPLTFKAVLLHKDPLKTAVRYSTKYLSTGTAQHILMSKYITKTSFYDGKMLNIFKQKQQRDNNVAVKRVF
jgi:hypothetical protein